MLPQKPSCRLCPLAPGEGGARSSEDKRSHGQGHRFLLAEAESRGRNGGCQA